MELSSKQMMNLSGWNERRGFAKPITDENKKLNDYLKQSRSSYVECYRQMIIHKKELTMENFKKVFCIQSRQMQRLRQQFLVLKLCPGTCRG
jgi:hypothetical protein